MNQQRQHGIAIITVLLIVSLATIIAVSMASHQQLFIRRTQNILQTEQAYLYALGGESWAKQILLRDSQNVDSLDEMWAMQLPSLPIEGGTLTGKIEDLQGRFNLNNLLQENGQVDKESMAIFERLLIILELSPDIAQAALDWMDNNQDIYMPQGAEDNVYLLENRAYRTADHLFVSPSELRLLKGVDVDTYQTLLPYICTLPARTAININTTSPFVLRSLVETMSEEDAIEIIKYRQDAPFKSIEEFLRHDVLAGREVDTKNMTVASHYFLVNVTVQIDRGYTNLYSILQRLPQKITTIMRSQAAI